MDVVLMALLPAAMRIALSAAVGLRGRQTGRPSDRPRVRWRSGLFPSSMDISPSANNYLNVKIANYINLWLG